MNTCNSSLVPYNQTLDKLKDDNFESINFENNTVENFEDKSEEEFNDDEYNKEETKNSIEGFSNAGTCTIAYGDLIHVNNGELVASIIDNNFTFKNPGKHSSKIYILPALSNSRDFGKAVRYGDQIIFSKVKKKYNFVAVKTKKTWQEHDNAAKLMGGHLACPTNWHEQYWMNVAARNKFGNQVYWIGGKRKRNGRNGSGSYWRWSSGAPWTYTRWDRGQPGPTEDAIAAYSWSNHGVWHDYTSNHKFYAVYSIPTSKMEYYLMPPPGSGKKIGDNAIYGDRFLLSVYKNTFMRTLELDKRYKAAYDFIDVGYMYGVQFYEYNRGKITLPWRTTPIRRVNPSGEIRYEITKERSAVNKMEQFQKGKMNFTDDRLYHFYYYPEYGDFYWDNKKGSTTHRWTGTKPNIKRGRILDSSNTSMTATLSDEKKSGFVITKPKNSICSIKVPKMIMDNNYHIKKVTIRCDDIFEMYLGARKYRPKNPNWRKTFTYHFDRNNQVVNTKGFTMAFRCWNGGGPGCLIAEIELYNGSFIVTDGDWDSAVSIKNPGYFLTNPNNYPYGREWRPPRIIGPNQTGKLRWNGKKVKQWDKYFVDPNFSENTYWICANNNVYKKGWTYFKKDIGENIGTSRCRHNLTFGQALCYVEKYPDIKNWILNYATAKHKFELNLESKTFSGHEREARRRGGHLASITNNDEWLEAKKILDNGRAKGQLGGWGFWIGGVRKTRRSYHRGSDDWRWTDGSAWSFTKWHSNYEPNNYREGRVHMWWNASWNDLPGGYRLPGLYKIRIPGDAYDLNKIVYYARFHWKYYGCTLREGRTFDCAKPPETVANYGYEGCRFNDYDENTIPEYKGRVRSLAECADKAEKAERMVFGAINGKDCYIGNDVKKAKKNKIAPFCPTLGRIGAYQVYGRKFPFDPDQPEISSKNFNEKFTNKKDKINYITLILLLLFIILLMYCYLK